MNTSQPVSDLSIDEVKRIAREPWEWAKREVHRDAPVRSCLTPLPGAAHHWRPGVESLIA